METESSVENCKILSKQVLMHLSIMANLFILISFRFTLTDNKMERELGTINEGKNGLDNDYTLFESGKVIREYDRHIYPGGQNRKQEYLASDLPNDIKTKLLEKVQQSDIGLAKELLNI